MMHTSSSMAFTSLEMQVCNSEYVPIACNNKKEGFKLEPVLRSKHKCAPHQEIADASGSLQ
jgi:hypothetical protein